jgi:hypothetical protein
MIDTVLNCLELVILLVLSIQYMGLKKEISFLDQKISNLMEHQSHDSSERDLNRRLTEIQNMRFSSMVRK